MKNDLRRLLCGVVVFMALVCAAVQAQEAGDSKALEELKQKAEAGDADAQCNLGLMYDNGRGVEQDYKQAAEWYRKAAVQGEAAAQYNLGLMHYNGEGVEQDYRQAAEWYRKAAAQGNAAAQFNLGLMHYNGEGVEQDYRQAAEWYRKAAEQGYAAAQSNLGVMYANGEGVEKDYKQAVEWWRKAAAQGDAAAQSNLGVMYRNGRGVEQDYKQAAEWYRKAAAQGNADAQSNLGVMYANGQGVIEDYKQAVEWYRKAAVQGEAAAQSNLGVMYANGEGVEKDYKQAVEWYRKAAVQGYAAAQYNLGVMYDNGKGVIEDYVEAYKWYLLAGMNGVDVSTAKEGLRGRMTAFQIAEAQRLAKEFVPKKEGSVAGDGSVMTNSIGMKLVFIPSGAFQMGSIEGEDGEKPVHRVEITKGFWMGQYEVTQEEYQKVTGSNPSYFKGSNLPVEQVTWDEVVEFCRKLSQKEGKTYRLPTEAEWEYACRAGTTTKYSFGDDASRLGDYAWYDGNSGIKTHPVGQKKPNAWGLYDMYGNMLEWCNDWYGDYSAVSQSNPTGPTTGSCRVLRGGSRFDNAYYCRVACRSNDTPGYRRTDYGFRLVLDLN